MRVCHACFLVQADDAVPADAIFDGAYAYFSSYSTSWVEHARRYAAAMTERFGLGPESLVVEVASNDGYLLQHFVSHGHARAGRGAYRQHRRGGARARRAHRGRVLRRQARARPRGARRPAPT